MLVFCMFLFWTKEVLGSVACNESCKEEILSSLTPIIESLVTETRTLKQEVQHLKLELEIQKKKNSVGSIGQKLVHDYSESGTSKITHILLVFEKIKKKIYVSTFHDMQATSSIN